MTCRVAVLKHAYLHVTNHPCEAMNHLATLGGAGALCCAGGCVGCSGEGVLAVCDAVLCHAMGLVTGHMCCRQTVLWLLCAN